VYQITEVNNTKCSVYVYTSLISCNSQFSPYYAI